MYIEAPTSQFKKELKLAKKRNMNLHILETVVDIIKNGQSLPPEYKEHYLTNNYKGCRECHLSPDWLLIYKIDKKSNKVYLLRLGSHSELFNEDIQQDLSISQLNEILTKYI